MEYDVTDLLAGDAIERKECEEITEWLQKKQQLFFLRERGFAYWRETFEVTMEKLILLRWKKKPFLLWK